MPDLSKLGTYVPNGQPVRLVDWYAYGEAAMCELGLCFADTTPEAAKVYEYLDNALGDACK